MEEEIIKIWVNEFIGKFRSKTDLYNFLTLKFQLFLPPYEETKLNRTTNYEHPSLNTYIDSLKDLMNGSNDSILSCKVNRVKAPRYPEVWELTKHSII